MKHRQRNQADRTRGKEGNAIVEPGDRQAEHRADLKLERPELERKMPTASEWTEHKIELPGRGQTFVRESRGNENAPTLFLLHGLGATGLLNWRTSFNALSEQYRVVVIDHHGHGRGVRARTPFRLVDCADDAASVARELNLDRFVAVGYSMGGPIAQLLWQRHRDIVKGMVLCATACRFAPRGRRRLSYAVSPILNTLGRITPRNVIRSAARRWLSEAITDPGIRDFVMAEVGSSDFVTIGQAAAAIQRYSSLSWIDKIDVPASVVLTENDRLVPAKNQQIMADRIRGAVTHCIPGDHSVCVTRPELFVPALTEACESVLERAGNSS
jgi:3-oxoadipate enol-lactonase